LKRRLALTQYLERLPSMTAVSVPQLVSEMSMLPPLDGLGFCVFCDGWISHHLESCLWRGIGGKDLT
jgi:hypothetical protein